MSKQLCLSHHTFGNDKIKFDQHIWINMFWSFVALCLLLWMCACFISTCHDHPCHVFKKSRGEMGFYYDPMG
jgi:hypothetical protein